jgi:hypothetical protein
VEADGFGAGLKSRASLKNMSLLPTGNMVFLTPVLRREQYFPAFYWRNKMAASIQIQ